MFYHRYEVRVSGQQYSLLSIGVGIPSGGFPLFPSQRSRPLSLTPAGKADHWIRRYYIPSEVLSPHDLNNAMASASQVPITSLTVDAIVEWGSDYLL